MANTLTKVIPQLLAQGLMALREKAFMPRLVNRGYEEQAGERGSTIDIPIPSAVTVQDVTPANTPPTTADQTPTSVSIPMNSWKEAPFHLSDKDQLEVMRGFLPMQASEAIKALANQVNTDIFSLYKSVYGFAGTAGTTPFASDLTSATNARKTLEKQLAPPDPRYLVLDSDAEGNALNLRAIQDQSWRSNGAAIVSGQIARTMGFDWFAHQLVPTHTAGTAASATTNAAGYAVGSTTITLASAGTGTFVTGDIITFAGQSQTYVVVTGDSDVSNGGTLVISPPLKVAIPASATAITVKGNHVVNLAFHRDAFAFASRPLNSITHPAVVQDSVVDPDSGLALRLQVTHEHKRVRFSYDILYGFAVVRAELAARLAG